MLVVFNASGGFQKVDFENDKFVKGDYSVHTIKTLIVDDNEYDTYNYSGFIQFKRQDNSISPQFIMTPEKIEYNGVVHNGYTYKMQGDWFTTMAGTLDMTIEIKKFSDVAVETTKAYGMVEIIVEDSVIEDTPTTITNEEYIALVNLINSKLSIDDEKVYNMQTVYGNTEVFAQACIEKLNELQRIKIFWGYILDDDGTLDSALGLVGDKKSSVLVISGKGQIEKYKNNELQVVSIPYLYTEDVEIGNAAIDLLRVTGDIDISNAEVIIKTPTSENDLVPKKYVDDKFGMTYSRFETDTLLKNKANNSEVYTKSETYTKKETDKKIADLVNSAPETLDTLGEIAESIKENQDIIVTLNKAISNKANISEVYSKQEVNVLLNTKSNITTTYTKTETDNLLTEKANNSEVYSKEEIDDFLKNINVGSAELVEFTEKAGFPKGEVKKLYIATDTLKLYTWSGYSFVPLLSKDLNNKANVENVYTKTEIDAKETALNNSIATKVNSSDVYTKTETDNKIAALVNSAPETLDTLGELATAFQENKDVLNTLNDAISNKANVEDVYTKDDVYTKTEVDNKFSNQELSNYYNKEEINQIVNNNFNVTVKADGSSTSDSLLKITAENYRNTCVYLTEEATGLTYILSFDKALEQEENTIYYWINEKYTYVIVLDKNGNDNSLYYMLNETDYYTKTEADALLNKKANLNDVYTKKQIDSLLGGENGEVNLSNYYTKEETEKISGGYEINPQNDGNYISLTKELIYNNKIQKSYVTFDNYKFVCRFIGFIKDTENTTYIWQSLNLKFTMTFTNTDLSFVKQKREDLSYLTALETYEAIDNKANKSNVYTKIETNELLNQKANRSDVYSKEEVYGKHETYSKTQIESLLSGGNGEVNLSNYYTKTETNNLIAENKEIVNFTEASGFPENGDTKKLYVAGDTLKIYTWTGSSYIQLYHKDFRAKANVDDVYSKVVMDDLLATKISTNQKGVANGVAELDSNGKVPTSQLPSYVDDVLEFSSKSVFPTTGESGKIYVALDTNITYRWGGSEYVEISSSLALGETSSTAYAGDKGKANADAITALQTRATNIEANKEDKTNLKALAYKDSLGKSDVGLGNVDNTSDLNKPISTATQAALDAKANNSDVYLRETVNGLLATKADLSNTYTKNEVDTIVGNINTILDTLNGEVI